MQVRTPFAEMVKIARADAFERSLWQEVLAPIGDDYLATDSYMMTLWCTSFLALPSAPLLPLLIQDPSPRASTLPYRHRCILAEAHFPGRPGCVLLRHQVSSQGPKPWSTACPP